MNAVNCNYSTMQMDYRNVLIISSGLLLMLVVGYVRSQCNNCAVGSELACVSETEFRMCVEGSMMGPVYPCAGDAVCSTQGRCLPRSESAIAPCADCDQCDGTGTFACKGPRQFALCLGNGAASDIVGECREDYVCNIDYRYICAAEADGFFPTCNPTTEAPSTTAPPEAATTTPSPVAEPARYCSFFSTTGRYPVGTNANTTCRQYLLCMQRNDVWIGALYYCPNRYYFDDVSRSCTETAPSRCSAGVRSLSIFDIQLY